MRDRVVAVVTLLLLNLAIAGAAGAVVKLTPARELAPRAAAVAVGSLTQPTPTVAATPAAPKGSAGVPAGLAAQLKALTKPYINAIVTDVATGRVLYAQNPDAPTVPASTNKLATSAAVLAALGPDHRLTTKVVQNGSGGVVLVGGGDATLAGPWGTAAKLATTYPRPASLTELAQQTATALSKAGTTRVTVDYDASMFTGPASAPGWKPDYLPGYEVAPITSLMTDQGLVAPEPGDPDGQTRYADPANAATRQFVSLLKRDGISAKVGRPAKAPATAAQLAAVQGPPISDLVEQLLTISDNDLAEQMARLTAVHEGLPGSFQGGVQGVRAELAKMGLAQGVNTYDGSGLSHANHITPRALAKIIATAASADHPELRAVITGMPVAGFSGTLLYRYRLSPTSQGAGYVRAKTGTVDNVNTLAGLAYNKQGRLLAFAFMANEPKVSDASAALASIDEMAAVLAAS